MSRAEDDDRLVAAADLCGRAGAREFQVGYLHDDVPAAEAGWYAHATYAGARVTAEDHSSPWEAAEALAVRLLTGAKCKCGRLVALSPAGAVAFTKPVMADGSAWTAEAAAAAGQCLWQRQGARWEPGCDAPPIELGRRL